MLQTAGLSDCFSRAFIYVRLVFLSVSISVVDEAAHRLLFLKVSTVREVPHPRNDVSAAAISHAEPSMSTPV